MNKIYMDYDWSIVHLPNSRGTKILFSYNHNDNKCESIMTGIISGFKENGEFINIYIKDSQCVYKFRIDKFINEYKYLEEEFKQEISNIKIIRNSFKLDLKIKEIKNEY